MIQINPTPSNRLLAALGPEDLGRIVPYLERVELDRLADAHEASPLLRRLLAWYVQAFLAEVMVSAACHALHAAAARLARWLLLVRDRAGLGAELLLTQEFLALMLGLQRTTVT